MSAHEPWAVSHRVEYAVRALVALARADGPLTAEQIAGAEGIPRLYLLAILRTLATGGLLASRRGRRGGFALIRDPADLSVDEVVRVLDQNPDPDSVPPDGPVGPIPELWSAAHGAARGVLAGTTIADLAATSEPDVRTPTRQ